VEKVTKQLMEDDDVRSQQSTQSLPVNEAAALPEIDDRLLNDAQRTAEEIVEQLLRTDEFASENKPVDQNDNISERSLPANVAADVPEVEDEEDADQEAILQQLAESTDGERKSTPDLVSEFLQRRLGRSSSLSSRRSDFFDQHIDFDEISAARFFRASSLPPRPLLYAPSHFETRRSPPPSTDQDRPTTYSCPIQSDNEETHVKHTEDSLDRALDHINRRFQEIVNIRPCRDNATQSDPIPETEQQPTAIVTKVKKREVEGDMDHSFSPKPFNSKIGEDVDSCRNSTST